MELSEVMLQLYLTCSGSRVVVVQDMPPSQP